MELTLITPLILTYNEEANIARTLSGLEWAERIVVVDSYSTDGTVSVLEAHPQVMMHQRTFDNHRAQWNYGLDQIETDWVLSLDADYVLSTTFVRELRTLQSSADGYFAHFRYCVLGKPLRSSLYPPRLVLFRCSKGQYIQDGHTQRLQLNGATDYLETPIYHDDRKSIGAWLKAQQRYAQQEVGKLDSQPFGALSIADRLRKTGLAPFAVPAYCLIRKGLILDGKAGLYYTLQRTYAEVLLALHILDHRLRSSHDE